MKIVGFSGKNNIMSLYNMIMGVKPATFFILPMLGRHTDEYPRFRDCFLADEEHPEYDDYIHVYTRMGGGNRGCWDHDNIPEGSKFSYIKDGICQCPGCKIKRITEEDEHFVATFDESFDSTYATYVFKVPEEWKPDFERVKAGEINATSKKYQLLLYKIYPKLKDKFDTMFPNKNI